MNQNQSLTLSNSYLRNEDEKSSRYFSRGDHELNYGNFSRICMLKGGPVSVQPTHFYCCICSRLYVMFQEYSWGL